MLGLLQANSLSAGPKVVVEGDVIQEWTFGPNNTLTFKAQQGFDGWLQFVHLPGSPIVVGKIREFEGNTVNSAPFLCIPSFSDCHCISPNRIFQIEISALKRSLA